MRTGWLKLLFSGPLDLPGSKVRPPFAGIEESLRAWRARVAPNEWAAHDEGAEIETVGEGA
jgi:hypothetical protein